MATLYARSNALSRTSGPCADGSWRRHTRSAIRPDRPHLRGHIRGRVAQSTARSREGAPAGHETTLGWCAGGRHSDTGRRDPSCYSSRSSGGPRPGAWVANRGTTLIPTAGAQVLLSGEAYRWHDPSPRLRALARSLAPPSARPASDPFDVIAVLFDLVVSDHYSVLAEIEIGLIRSPTYCYFSAPHFRA
jgi:hypothetical protein